MDRAEIEKRIQSFPRWHYEFDLGGVKTPIFKPGHVNRHIQRKRYFFDPLVRLCGGSLAGKRVLDLGCNAGFWSLAAIEAGADYVFGIDGREMHVEQSEFVFEARELPREKYDFALGNVFEYDFARRGTFDVVLFLGLMYHIAKPVEIMDIISRANTDLLVIDTAVSILPGSYMRLKRENIDDPKMSADYTVVMHPSCQAVVDLAETFGYRAEVLKPRFTDYGGATVYRKGFRRGFICAKQTDLAGLDVPVERPSRRSRLAALGRFARRTARDILKGRD